VTPAEALSFAKGAAAVNQLDISEHAFDSHNATRRDVRLALKSATVAAYQPESGRWRIEGGRDDEGRPLTIVVVFEGGRVAVITAF